MPPGPSAAPRLPHACIPAHNNHPKNPSLSLSLFLSLSRFLFPPPPPRTQLEHVASPHGAVLCGPLLVCSVAPQAHMNSGPLTKWVKTQLWGSLASPTARRRPDSRRALFTVVCRGTGLPGTVAVHRSATRPGSRRSRQDPDPDQEGLVIRPPTLPPQLEDHIGSPGHGCSRLTTKRLRTAVLSVGRTGISGSGLTPRGTSPRCPFLQVKCE